MLYKNAGGILRTQAELIHPIGQYLPTPGHQSQKLGYQWSVPSGTHHSNQDVFWKKNVKEDTLPSVSPIKYVEDKASYHHLSLQMMSVEHSLGKKCDCSLIISFLNGKHFDITGASMVPVDPKAQGCLL